MGVHIIETDQKNNNPEFLQKSWVTQMVTVIKSVTRELTSQFISALNSPLDLKEEMTHL